MKKVLLVCQAGISTSYLTNRINDYIHDKKCNIEVKAIPVHETRNELESSDYDLLLFTPQLKFLYKSYLKEYKDKIEIKLIELEDMASMNVERIVAAIADC